MIYGIWEGSRVEPYWTGYVQTVVPKTNQQKGQSHGTFQLAPPCVRITLTELKALRVNHYSLNPGLKNLSLEPGRLGNHDFHDFSDFHQNAHPGWSPTRNWEIRQRKRNWMGVGSNDRSFNAWSRKNSPVENELGDFSQSWKNYPSPHKNLNYFKGAN